MESFVNDEAESMTIGAVLRKAELMDDVVTLLDTDDFYYPANRELFKLCRELHEKNKLDFPTLKQWIRQNERENDVGGMDYVDKLYAAIPTLRLTKEYAEIVRNYAIKRKGMWLAEQIKDFTIDSETMDNEEYLRHLNQLFGSLDMTKKGQLTPMSSIVPNHLKEKFTGETKKYPLLGLSDIDHWMNGIGDNRLIVVAGRPGAGKTAFALQSSYHISKQSFGAVPVFSMEMGKGELVDRQLSNISGVYYSKINRNELDELEKKRVENAGDLLKAVPLHIDDTPRMDIAYITAQCRKLKREQGKLGCIVIDYLGLLDKHQKKTENTSDAIGNMTRECKLLARELGCSIFLLVQMNREIDKRSTKRPILSDLRDSGSIEQDADMVIFLHKDVEKTQGNIDHVDFIVAKGRQTGMRDFELAFVGEIQRIASKAVYR